MMSTMEKRHAEVRLPNFVGFANVAVTDAEHFFAAQFPDLRFAHRRHHDGLVACSPKVDPGAMRVGGA